MIRFVVDPASWHFPADASTADLESAFGALLERIEVAAEREEVVVYGDNLFEEPVYQGLTFWDLFSETSPVEIDFELRIRAAAAFTRLGRWQDCEDWPISFDVEIDGGVEENPEVAFAHHRVLARAPVACLGMTHHRAGRLPVVVGNQAADVHWVTDEEHHVRFFRDAIDVEGDNEDTIERLCTHAWPTLEFGEVWRGLRDFDGGYARVRVNLRRSLDVLADHGHWIFTDPTSRLREQDTPREGRQPDVIQQRFLGHGMDVAPEHANVAADQTCRTARERRLGDHTLYCEWHVKLEPHRNRVHVHPPVAASRNRVYVAIFHAHLPLPGDR